ncbi:hypothetical protein [Actinomadura latina]|uniref:Uncharacterized protein n=1 Tax=Actinomadura latina TaxID=163603 RepID=A0A846ZBQ8_9ACTN|nr:hypothetical protein [Actinomadura latina]NKZ08164.1 hypothetical protein [Actinomadura latina]
MRYPRMPAASAALFAVIAALQVMFPVGAPAAHAAEKKDGGRPGASDARTLAWTPSLTPLDSRKERVKPNLTTEQRNNLLHNCWSGYLCVAVGEGDGQHTVFELWYCTRRTLSNFLGAGAVTNNQYTVYPAVLRDRNYITRMTIPTNNVPTRVDDWGPIWYIDVC